MKKIVNIAAGLGVAGAIGAAALGFGSATANAAPPSPIGHFAEWGHGWGPGPGPWRPGPPPPPPAWGGGYDYGGWNDYGPPPPPCLSGPLGFLQVCA
jgi:hypothetical protein